MRRDDERAYDRHQLQWVQRNRTRGRAVRDVGVLIKCLLEDREARGDVRRASVAAILAEHVDDGFRAHCRLGAVRGAVLTVCVDHPTLLGYMRAKWLRVLRSVLQSNGRHCGIGDVAFELGKEGMEIPATV